MPYFILPALWVVFFSVGCVMALFSKLRPLAFRIMFGSTGALLGSLLFSVVFPILILAVLKVFGASRLDWLAGVTFLAALPTGAVTGLLSGFALARIVTAKMGKQPASAGGIDAKI